MKCLQCGYEPPRPPRRPYEYTGYLKPSLPIIIELLHEGKGPDEIVQEMAARGHIYPPYDPREMIAYIRRRYDIDPPQHRAEPVDKRSRNNELIKRYLGGAKLTDLGRTYGISPTRVRQIVSRALKRAGQMP